MVYEKEVVGWKMMYHPQGQVNDFEICQGWRNVQSVRMELSILTGKKIMLKKIFSVKWIFFSFLIINVTDVYSLKMVSTVLSLFLFSISWNRWK